MTDSLTQSDIDRIYGRLTEQIDLSKIKNKKQLFKAVTDNPRTKKWNTKLNDFFWDVHTSREEVLEAVPEIEEIPTIPRERLTPIEKRRQTLKIKERIIDVRGSYKQRKYTRSIGRRWEDVEIKFAQRLRKDNLTYKQISEQLNRTYSSVSTKIYRLMKGGK